MDIAELGRFQFKTKAFGLIEIKGLNSIVIAEVNEEFEQIKTADPYDFALHLISRHGLPVEDGSEHLTIDALRDHLTKEEIDRFSDKLIGNNLFMLTPYGMEKDPDTEDGDGIRLTLAEGVSKRKKDETATEHLLRIHLANLDLQRVAAREYAEKFKDGMVGGVGLSSIPESPFDSQLDFTKKYEEFVKAAQGANLPGQDDLTRMSEEIQKAAQGANLPGQDDLTRMSEELQKAVQGANLPGLDDYAKKLDDLDGWSKELKGIDIEGYGISSATEDALRSYQDSLSQFKELISTPDPVPSPDPSDLELGPPAGIEEMLETGLVPVIETNTILSRLEESFGEFGRHVTGAISLLSNVNDVTVNLHKDFVQNSAITNSQNTRLLHQNTRLLWVAVSSLLLTLAMSVFGFIAQRENQLQTLELLQIMTAQQTEIEQGIEEDEATMADDLSPTAAPTLSAADPEEHAPTEDQKEGQEEPSSTDDPPPPISDRSQTDPASN